jgi:hypothetical protein
VPVTAVALAAVLLHAQAGPATPRAESFVLLSDTGERRDDLPVVVPHPSPEPYVTELTRGFSGRLLRLYPMVQRFAHPERQPQPAYLVLSGNQGGFPRFGMYLDGRRLPHAAYVDLHRNGDLANRFGAMNQIYPHELLHIIVTDLLGPPPGGRANQIHAIGVRTDRVTAFSEGFAEHAQLMAVDAEGVAPDTRRLLSDAGRLARANEQSAAYRDAVAARWSIAPKARMTFALWFSPTEQVLRYHAVRDNLFAREAPVPRHLRADLYRAYLLENTMPGPSRGAPKSAARMVATEGVISTLFYRLASSDTLRRQYRDDGFYRAFGVARAEIDPVDNVYVKLFAAIKAGAYDAVAVVDAYTRLFPEDAGAVGEVVRSTLLGQELPRAEAIWLMSDRLTTGRSLFDQYRGMPRAHTFDLNAASALDLLSVRGVTPEMAAAILAAAPYQSVDDLRRAPGAASVAGEFAQREAAYREHVSRPDARGSLSFRGILYPYLWRALYAVLACAVLSGALYAAVRRARWYRLVINGVAVALVGLVAGWTIDAGTGVLAFAAPIGILGMPAAVIALWRTRSPRSAGVVLAAWALASLVPALIVRPMG